MSAVAKIVFMRPFSEPINCAGAADLGSSGLPYYPQCALARHRSVCREVEVSPNARMLIAGCAATKVDSLAGIHAAAAQPRLAGTIGRQVVVSLPGSEAAVRLALEKLLIPELGHLVREAGR